MINASRLIEDDNVSVSVIIVNYNGKGFFDACLRSIAENVPYKHEVIVVDNASNDGSADYLQETHPDVILIKSKLNVGFAGGNNIGARQASGKYLLLLNNDTILQDDLYPALVAMENNPSIGAAGIRMLGRKGEYRYSAGHFPEPWRLVKFSSLYQKSGRFQDGEFPKGSDPYDVDWIEGSFLLTRAQVWREVGGLDEGFFMYVEDIDFAKKIKDAGKRVVYLPNLAYVHFGGYGEGRIGMLIHGFRRYHGSHSPYCKRLLANIVLDLGLLVRAFVSLCLSITTRQETEKALRCLKALRRSR